MQSKKVGSPYKTVQAINQLFISIGTVIRYRQFKDAPPLVFLGDFNLCSPLWGRFLRLHDTLTPLLIFFMAEMPLLQIKHKGS